MKINIGNKWLVVVVVSIIVIVGMVLTAYLDVDIWVIANLDS